MLKTAKSGFRAREWCKFMAKILFLKKSHFFADAKDKRQNSLLSARLSDFYQPRAYDRGNVELFLIFQNRRQRRSRDRGWGFDQHDAPPMASFHGPDWHEGGLRRG